MLHRASSSRPVALCAVLLLALTSVSALAITVQSTQAVGKRDLSDIAYIRGYPERTNTDRPANSQVSTLSHSTSSDDTNSMSSSSRANTNQVPVYPQGDCVTQCSVDPAARMAHCTADPATGIPATRCQAVGEVPDVCPSLRYPDAFNTEAYCMPRFASDCSHPDNFGCSKRCALYMIITYNCVTDAYFMHNRTFNPDCVACNMCWDKSEEQREPARLAPYALVWARGPFGALFVNHWLVLPKRACSGIESTSPGCTDAAGEYIWANAYHEAQQLGFNYTGGAPTWGLWLNAPNRRGVHQMHIHISHFESKRSVPDVPRENWLARKVAAATGVSEDPAAPTRILGEGFYNPRRFKGTPLGRPPKNWARAYVVHVPSEDPAADLGHSIKPFELARQISAASDLPSHSYGIVVMPRSLQQQPGLLVAAVWSTSDTEQLDENETKGDPIRYSHTCYQYIAAPFAARPLGKVALSS